MPRPHALARRWTLLLALLGALPEISGAAADAPSRRAALPQRFTRPAGPHVLLVGPAEAAAIAPRLSRRSILDEVDYGTFRLLRVDDAGLAAARDAGLPASVVRDDLDLIAVGRFLLDTRAGDPAELPARRREDPGSFDGQLHLVHLAGPARDEWLERLAGPGDVDVVAHVPSGGYVVRTSRSGWRRIQRLVAERGSGVDWAGAYHPAYRIAPELEEAIAQDAPAVEVVVQVVEGPRADAAARELKAGARAVLAGDLSLGGLRDLRLSVPASALEAMATRPDVFWIEPAQSMQLLDERQGQILAGNLDPTGTQPSAPGYLAWLQSKGFGATFGFTVDVADDGFDRGSTSDVHGDFRDGLGASRVTYVYNYSTDPTGDGGAGHGNINCAIVGGRNDVQGSAADEDAGGYQYGLGIAPHVRLGSSKIFSSAGAFTSTPYATLIANAYNGGARASNNSWGADSNAYTTDARAYDFLVRDAVSATAGNQEMSIVFAAGNSGPGANTVGTPATAKNVISVGAAENFRQTGTDGCGVANAGADNARDVIGFSSRGPCGDGRVKPDIQAPGTHVQGAASRSTSYDGSGVCNAYWPAGQTKYCWSSGTSHSAPAVAGAVALARQHFTNQGWGTPSPAMVKALLLATATYMNGTGAGGTLPSNSQGYGRLDLGRALDGTATIRLDQSQVLGATGATYATSGVVASASRPLRVMLAWTDAPGAANGNAWVNDLDLEVTVAGTLYRGNVFSGATSVAGGSADRRNNTEAVFLPAGTTGSFSITVRAAAINGNGVPGNADATDQDFALLVYNGTTSAPSPDFTVSATPASRTVNAGASTTYATTVTSTNGFSSATTLTVTGLPAGASGSFAPNPVTPPASGSSPSTLTVTTSSTTPAGTSTLTITGTSGALVRTTTVQLVVAPSGGTSQVLTFVASPNASIPDNNTTGIESTIAVPDSMTITSVGVYTQISHAYRGDLEVTLVGPDGTGARLHDRAGGSADNLVTTFSTTTRSATSLSVFNGRNTNGTWRLRVRDLAAADVGTLQSWKLAFNGFQAAAPRLPIPDSNTTGVSSVITVPATGVVASLRVRVAITHTYRGDLHVALVGPDRTTVVLHDRAGGSADHLSTVYPDLTAPAQSLAAFNGKPTQGTWTLVVRDLAAADVGTLDSWELDLRTR